MTLLPADYIQMLTALGQTALFAALGTLLAAALGLPLAAALRSGKSWLVWPVRAYVELMRGVPFVLLLFLLYYGGPAIGVSLSAATTGILGLALFGAGAFAEIYRTGLAGIPRGEVEAARMLGLTPMASFRRIELPRAIRLVLAPMAGQVIVLIKESSVLSIITVAELTKTAGQISSYTFSVMPYVLAALGYWLLVELVARAGFGLERHFNHKTKEAA